MTKSENLIAGDIINNGFYDIELIERPRWNDTHNRWFARGYRWLKTRKAWEAKPRLYGWDGDPLPPHMGSWRA